MKLSIKELTPNLWQDLETLLGDKGASGGCLCMTWRIEKGEKWSEIKGPTAKARFKKLVQSGKARGLLAYDRKEPIGWCTFGKRTAFPRLNRAPSLKCEDAENVCSIPCFYVKSGYRKKGVSTALLKMAALVLGKEKESVIEGDPVKPSKPGDKNIPGAFAWTGTIPLFEKQGFDLVGRPTTAKLRYRKALKRSSD